MNTKYPKNIIVNKNATKIQILFIKRKHLAKILKQF